MDQSQPAPPTHLPDDFTFTQSNLQAFDDCARRFWLTYVERLPWPAVEAAPVHEHEYLMRLGAQFHLLVQRAEIGLDPALVELGLPDPLDAWYAAYRAYRPADLPTARIEVERTLTVRFELDPEVSRSLALAGPIGFPLSAKYDLIACEESGRAIIVDWKTGRRRPQPESLRRRLQTLVYLYVLVEAAPSLGWGTIAPEQVEMRYWFTAAPDQPITFRYDESQHAATQRRLQLLIGDILSRRTAEDFELAPDGEMTRIRLCRYCAYRSRCDRGITPGRVDDLDDLEELVPSAGSGDLDFNFADVAELSF